LPIVPATVDVRPVAPAERRPAAPREEIDGKGGGEKAIKTRRRREREKRITI